MAIRKSLLQLIFSGSYMLRWNDRLRPMELLEIDKQAHKMLLACALGFENTRECNSTERLILTRDIIEGGLFDYFYRLIITDIKPPVFYRIKENPEHYRQLTEHVLRKLEPIISPLDEAFWQRMCAYHQKSNDTDPARRILEAAHQFASFWEFQRIYPFNTFDDAMEQTKQGFEEDLNTLRDIRGVNALLEQHNPLARFANICGQLRFQIRWTQAPRIPATSVLGHMFAVAAYAYFYSLSIGACPTRCCNNFFCGLFHDLPELLTRDIISPVKHSFASLPDLIKEYEEEELERRIFTPLCDGGYEDFVERVSYYLGIPVGSEFDAAVRIPSEGIRKIDNFQMLHKHYNEDIYDPRDGELIKTCDILAAFLEAHNSIRNGVATAHLIEAAARLRSNLLKCSISELQIEALLADFD